MQCTLSLTRYDSGHSSPNPQFLMALLSIWNAEFPAVKLCGLPHPPTQILVADGLDFLLVSSVGELVYHSNVTIRGLHFLSCIGFLGWEHKLGEQKHYHYWCN